ncbi:phosphotransferase family protein [uncultured Jatrophihabitans sp.]|uniref:phosphotransferase family protein n=1 Tax=uncultured Jatrophihabitans sp. TaxID=1610747 RepID=UPI0035CA0126
MAELPGVDLARLTIWLDDERPGLRLGELAGEVVAGGKSNLTYRITDGSSTWALRRPPLAHVLPTAHDMVREFTVINALTPAEVPVPVPSAVALCQDADVLGAPFYLMDFVDGVVLDKPDLLATLAPADADRACELLVDTLIALHEVDPAAVGLQEFGRPDGFLARQVRRWSAQWQASETRPLDVLPAVVRRLEATLPVQSAPGIVHGDYRLTNVMFTPDITRIPAVLDWEMATLGDPLTDVGLLVVYTDIAGNGTLTGPAMAPAQGFWTGAQAVEHYAKNSSRSTEHLDWHVGFGYFKLAVIAEGIHHRYLAGKTVGEGFAHFGDAVPSLLHSALDSLPGS